MFFTIFPSPLGELLLTSDGTALTALRFGSGDILPQTWRCDDLPVFVAARDWLEGYFAGSPEPVTFPISPAGSDFQQRVWALLQAVPYGEITTYGAIAKQLGPKMSAQAVGQAVGKNPIAIVIPCHRVLGAGGQLTGYAWGIETKTWLLRHEEETK